MSTNIPLLSHKIETSKNENLDNLYYIFFDKEIVNYFVNNYSEEIIDITLNKQSEVKRWQWLEWVNIKKEQTNKHHIFSMLYLYTYLSQKTPWLEKIINELDLIKSIVVHDIWEILTWDITLDQKESMSELELKNLEKKEEKWAIREILKLKFEWVSKDKIKKIIKIYKNYQENKLKRWNPNQNFVKMLDIIDALFYMIKYVPDLEKFDNKLILKKLTSLNEINSWFIEDYNINILKDFEKLFKNKETLNFIQVENFLDKSNYKYWFNIK